MLRNPNLPFTAKYDKKTRKEIKTYIRNEYREHGNEFKTRKGFVDYIVQRLDALGCTAPDGSRMNNACATHQVNRAVGRVRLAKNTKPRKAARVIVAKPAVVSNTLQTVLKDKTLPPEVRLSIVEQLLAAGIKV